MKHNMNLSKVTFYRVLRALTPAFVALVLSPGVLAQTSGYSILTTTPFPLNSNVAGSVTIRVKADPPQQPYLFNCSFAFSSIAEFPTSVTGATITVKHRFSGVPPPVVGRELFCDKTFPLPALAAGQYAINLDVGSDGAAGTPATSTILSLGSICVGPCVTQSVPLNFGPGAPLWGLTLASLFGLAGFLVRRRDTNRGN